jgi:hypothetical protein
MTNAASIGFRKNRIFARLILLLSVVSASYFVNSSCERAKKQQWERGTSRRVIA